MRMAGVATPFTSYTIPPSAPEPVAEAWAELNRVGHLYQDTSDDLKSAQQGLVNAQAADVKAIVEATNAGEDTSLPLGGPGWGLRDQGVVLASRRGASGRRGRHVLGRPGSVFLNESSSSRARRFDSYRCLVS